MARCGRAATRRPWLRPRPLVHLLTDAHEHLERAAAANLLLDTTAPCILRCNHARKAR